MRRVFVLCLLYVALQAVKSEKGCPDEDEIKPCVCTNSPFTYLLCTNISNAEDLRSVFINSARYTYNEVHIEYSTLQFLPHDMFESVPTIKIYLKNVTLFQLFDSPPEALEHLDTLHIENTKFIKGVIWDLIKPLKSLRIINIYFNSVKTLGRDFSESVTKNLQQLTFYATETKSISPGTFLEFSQLNKVACDAAKLTTLSRDIFPNPFTGSVLYFNDNKIATISDDMFSNMPNLQTLGLRNNQIAVLPETAFLGTGSKLEYLRLEGNPIKCDCRLKWLMRKKPTVLEGECVYPKDKHGKQLKELTEGDFNC